MNISCNVDILSTAPSSSREHLIRDFLSEARFPCVAAKSSLNKRRMHFEDYDSIRSSDVAADLCDRLGAFSSAYPDPGDVPASLVATFGDKVADEDAFESLMWSLLQALHDHDRETFEWDASVSSDPARSDFSFSIARRAFFVVGLHPAASRMARRAPVPCVVFNFHNQFESLKASGKYQTMQTVIRSRDMALQGSINPVLATFGERSEARQYAGRSVGNAWHCPFRA